MSTKHAVHLATCVATIVFALTLALPAFVRVPLPWYHPAERSWTFEVNASGIAMDFYGRVALASLAAALAAAAMYVIARRARREPSRRITAVVAVWAVSLTMLAITFYTWRLVHRTVTPPPTPSCYQR